MISVIELVQQLTQECFYYEIELENINFLAIPTGRDNKYTMQIVNLILPSHYRIEYLRDLGDLYEEEEFEQNNLLLIKKIVFLLMTMAMEKGMEGYKQVKDFLDLWNK